MFSGLNRKGRAGGGSAFLFSLLGQGADVLDLESAAYRRRRACAVGEIPLKRNPYGNGEYVIGVERPDGMGEVIGPLPASYLGPVIKGLEIVVQTDMRLVLHGGSGCGPEIYAV